MAFQLITEILRPFKVAHLSDVVAVLVDGPEPDQNIDGDEVPCWCVCLLDADGELFGRCIYFDSFDAATESGKHVSDLCGLELVFEACSD